MMHFNEFDHYKNCDVLDFASWDSYPLGQVERSTMSEEDKVRWARTGHPDWISWNHDVYRGLKGRRAFWVMEQGAGQVNWAPSNCIPAEGAVALWTAQAYAHGASCVSYFRWRAATIAQELMHSGILRHDETLDRGGQEIARMEMAGRAQWRGACPGRAVARLRIAVDLRHPTAQHERQLYQPDHALLFGAALAWGWMSTSAIRTAT